MPSAGELDDAAAVLLDLGIDQLAAVPLQRGERAFLVDPHQARVTRDIPGQDRGQATLNPFLAHSCRSL